MQPLSDVWVRHSPRTRYHIPLTVFPQEFDYNNQFWSQVNTSASPITSPSLMGAVGGIDTNIPFNLSGLQGPTNSFYLMGGISSSGSQLSPVPLSEIWQLDISGTLSSNLVDSLVGTWSKITAGNNTAVSGEGGTIVKQQLVSFSGCIGTPDANVSCPQPYSFVTDAGTELSVSPALCAVPRIGAAVVANKNTFSSSFSSQVFVLLGLFNNSLWDDGGNLQKGEVVS
jgi:hypothetical protein